MQYLFDHVARQTRLLYVGNSLRVAVLKGLSVALIHQRNWIVAARDQMLRTERLARASQRRMRTMSDRVVPKSFRRHARLFGQVLIRCGYLIADSIEQRRYQPAKLRDNALDVGVAIRNLADDHVHHHQLVFEGHANRSRLSE